MYIAYDEQVVEKHKRLKDLKQDRILGIDLNPNFIGLSVLKFSKDDNFQVLLKEVFDITKLQSNGTKDKVKFELQ